MSKKVNVTVYQHISRPEGYALQLEGGPIYPFSEEDIFEGTVKLVAEGWRFLSLTDAEFSRYYSFSKVIETTIS